MVITTTRTALAVLASTVSSVAMLTMVMVGMGVLIGALLAVITSTRLRKKLGLDIAV